MRKSSYKLSARYIFMVVLLIFATAQPSSAGGEIVVEKTSASLEQNQSLSLKNGYKLTVKEIEFDRVTGIKKIHLQLTRFGEVLDEKVLQNLLASNRIERYIYTNDISGKNVKVIRADLDLKYDFDTITNLPSNYSAELSNVYQYWEGSYSSEQDPFRILRIEIRESYGSRYLRVTLQHNQLSYEVFNPKLTTVTLLKDGSIFPYTPPNVFWGERSYTVIIDDNHSYPDMDEDDIFTGKIGFDNIPAFDAGNRGTLIITTDSGVSVSVNFTAISDNLLYEAKNTKLPVYSYTPGASIYVDGAFMGSTNRKIEGIPYGLHKVEMDMQGFNSWEKIIDVSSIEIECIAGNGLVYTIGSNCGKIGVSSIPSDASVYINGTYLGQTPVTFQSIPANSYTLELTLNGFQNWSSIISISKNDNQNIKATLIKESINSQKLQIYSNRNNQSSVEELPGMPFIIPLLIAIAISFFYLLKKVAMRKE